MAEAYSIDAGRDRAADQLARPLGAPRRDLAHRHHPAAEDLGAHRHQVQRQEQQR